jgi:hypothetical protein
MVSDGGGKDVHAHGQLLFPVDAVTDLFPVYQVFAVKYGYPREILKGTGDQVIILSHPAYTRVRIKSRYHRIVVGDHCIRFPDSPERVPHINIAEGFPGILSIQGEGDKK